MALLILPVILIISLAYHGMKNARVDMGKFKSALPGWILGIVSISIGALIAKMDSPPCQDQGDLCGIGFAGGIILILVGIGSFICGFTEYFAECKSKNSSQPARALGNRMPP